MSLLHIISGAARPVHFSRSAAQRKMWFHAVGVRFVKMEILSGAQRLGATRNLEVLVHSGIIGGFSELGNEFKRCR